MVDSGAARAAEVKGTLQTAGQTLIQKSAVLRPGSSSTRAPLPHLIRLHQELSPVRHNGKLVSHKIIYSGTVHLGYPSPQEFRVVYDTGSAHLIVPSTACNSSTCRKHTRYDLRLSKTGKAVNLDGQPIRLGDRVDEVTIAFGTAQVHGRFVQEEVCLGPAQRPTAAKPAPCVRANVVAATRLSSSPFDQFSFDGIFGLGLPALALSNNFSVFDILAQSGRLQTPHFAFFLAGDSKTEQSELAVGGHNPNRLIGPLSWVPLARTELGYWQVELVGVRIDGKALDVCRGGTCFGILDSGTSHLGVPQSQSDLFDESLTRHMDSVADCRFINAPEVVFELPGLNLTIGPRDYMRKLPLTEQMSMRPKVILPEMNDTRYEHSEAEAATSGGSLLGEASGEPAIATGGNCTPKLLALDWPRPVGPNIFILGAPIMQRYYTVFDWGGLKAGFGLARRAEDS